MSFNYWVGSELTAQHWRLIALVGIVTFIDHDSATYRLITPSICHHFFLSFCSLSLSSLYHLSPSLFLTFSLTLLPSSLFLCLFSCFSYLIFHILPPLYLSVVLCLCSPFLICLLPPLLSPFLSPALIPFLTLSLSNRLCNLHFLLQLLRLVSHGNAVIDVNFRIIACIPRCIPS